MAALTRPIFALFLVLAWLCLPSFAEAKTLDDVKTRDMLRCGVHPGLPGFSQRGPGGRWAGLDVDFCRAVAAAVLGNADKVEFIPVDTAERLSRLQSGDFDILSRTTTWTIAREFEYNILFIGVLFYDGQGFMVQRSSGISSLQQLSGKKICVQSNTTSIDNLKSILMARNITYEQVAIDDEQKVISTYASNDCDAVTTDLSALYAERITLDNPQDHSVIPDIISKEPLGPAVKMDDPEWFAIVRWVYYALIASEELGITQSNVGTKINSDDPNVRNLLGAEGDIGSKMGISETWARDAISAVGNYGEIFANNVGDRSELGIYRGLNGLWSERGLMYAPPIR